MRGLGREGVGVQVLSPIFPPSTSSSTCMVTLLQQRNHIANAWRLLAIYCVLDKHSIWNKEWFIITNVNECYQNIIFMFEDCCALHGFPVCSNSSFTNNRFLAGNIAIFLTTRVLIAVCVVFLSKKCDYSYWFFKTTIIETGKLSWKLNQCIWYDSIWIEIPGRDPQCWHCSSSECWHHYCSFSLHSRCESLCTFHWNQCNMFTLMDLIR